MKKRLLASLLASLMVLTMVPAAFAADAADLQSQINQGGTVALTDDYTGNITVRNTVTLDLAGHKLTGNTGNTITVESGANLTVTDSKAEGAVETNGTTAIYNKGTVTLEDGAVIRESGKGYTIVNHGAMTVTSSDVTVDNMKDDTSSLFENGYYDYSNRDGRSNPSLVIEDGYFMGGLNTIKNDDGATLTINDGIFTNYKQAAFQNHNVATINGGEFDGSSAFAAILNCGVCTETSAQDAHTTTITGGTFKGDLKVNVGKLTISGGSFTTNPSNFVTTGHKVVKNNDTYDVVEGSANTDEVKTDVVAGDTKADTSNVAADKQEEAKKVAESAKPTQENAIPTEEVTDADKNAALNNLASTGAINEDGTIPEGTTVTVEQRTYLDVKVTNYDTEAAEPTIEMNITPKVDTVAVAKKADGTETEAALKTTTAKVTQPTEVSVQLPKEFANKTIYIKHTASDGVVYRYEVVVGADGVAKFTTKNGFSPFVFSTVDDVVAEVNGNKYYSLQAAANDAANGATIVVKKNENLDLTFTETKSVKVQNGTTAPITVTFNGAKKTIAANATETLSYTKPTSGGGGGGAVSTTYKVTTSSVNNGGVNASPSTAAKGATVTITLSPNQGYKLGTLTVTDGTGKTVAVTKKSDTVYTFVMPASQVTVGVSYVKVDDVTGFADVTANDWYADAVKYVTDKGMMNGTGASTFAPKATTTRGMIVTVLYRLEKEPSAAAASFTDVASGEYYANAVAWASANGIVSGYGNGKFGPNNKITREQLAAILYRYAQFKKYDVSVGENTNILSYSDAQTVSEYAIPAIQWTCGSGVMTGKTGNKLDPKGSATRAEVAAMLMRFCENVAK